MWRNGKYGPYAWITWLLMQGLRIPHDPCRFKRQGLSELRLKKIAWSAAASCRVVRRGASRRIQPEI
ncbi:hypothetical protein L2E82_51957 [Cichorium intybus]|nr:hypothetical protein L2E82_51957 [Cichorium intybus]